MLPPRHILLASAALFAAAHPLRADVKLPAIFGDHMVLQENMKAPVWGTAAPGEEVTISVGANTAKATADDKGNWQAVLPPLPRQADPTTMKVSGKNTIIINDVLIGDVWVCSGQSNMEFPLGVVKKFGGAINAFGGAANADTAIPAAHDPLIHFFELPRHASVNPQTDAVAHWVVCTPETATIFSAVGYFFGLELRQHLNKPIGLIETSWGGTAIAPWISLPGLKSDPAFDSYVKSHDIAAAGLAHKAPAYETALAAYNTKVEELKKAGTPATQWPKMPSPPDGGARTPSDLYNGMIAPLVPYAIKGVIWYQGESNANNSPGDYNSLFPTLIKDWRANWNEGDFPFLYVQISRFHGNAIIGWPFVREAQLHGLSLPNTGMAVSVDLGDPNNIHPKDKVDVSHRLALAARHVAYGEDLVYSGPIYDSMKASGNAITVNFKNTGGALIIGTPPWIAPTVQPIPTTSLVGFTIAGADNKWVPAEAKIDGDTVVVSSPDVPQPVAVRYQWSNAPFGNLYNKESLPASPFRSDSAPFDPKADVDPHWVAPAGPAATPAI